ncbi:MAG TPA: hypothetical protein VL614_05465 [Acetobacteraceae bacterium]|jgi:hypothetical protein|nr:hypothetical protein [Acetobacteraceae bacterium]
MVHELTICKSRSRLNFYPLFRAEVGDFHPEPRAFGWQIYIGGDRSPVSRSAEGFAKERDAWNAAVIERRRLERMSLQ